MYSYVHHTICTTIYMLTTDRLAVIVQVEHYVSLSEEYQLDPVPFTPKIADIRYTTYYYMNNEG